MPNRSWGPRRTVGAAGAVALLLVACTVWLVRAPGGADLAAVLMVPLTVLTIAAAVWAARHRPTPPDLARHLAGRVVREQEHAIRQALRDDGNPRPADVGFRRPHADLEPELVGFRDDSGRATGTVRDLAAYFRSLALGRLVILGEPGAGKTVAALRLVLDLADACRTADDGGRDGVPVLFSLPGWKLDAEYAERASDDDLADRLDQWLVAQLTTRFALSRGRAARLVDDGGIVPVLDGLDELDAGGDRARAGAVVRALNVRGRRKVVLLCRREDYRKLARGQAGKATGLQDAQQIVLTPLSARQIREYLTYRFPDPDSPHGIQARWRPVVDALTGPDGERPLAAVLGRPWQLFLAVTAYREPTTDPAELTRMTPENVDDHLLAHLVPAVAGHVPRPGRGRGHYPAEHVQRWLVALARHLRATSTRRRWPAVDLYLDTLWPVAGWWTPRVLAAAVQCALAVTAAATADLVVADNVVWLASTLLVLGGVAAAAQTLEANPAPLRVVNLRRLATPGGRIPFLLWVAGGGAAAVGVASAVPRSETGAPALLTALAAGLLAGSLGGLMTSLSEPANATRRPSEELRRVLARRVVVATVSGLTALLAGLAVASVAPDARPDLVRTGGTAALVGLTVLVITTVFVDGWRLRARIAAAILSWRGVLPARPAEFFDWAYRAGLFRMSGTAIQFRHLELQRWLETRPNVVDEVYAWALADRGRFRLMTGLRDLGLADLDRAIGIDPDHVPVLLDRGEAHMDAGRYDAALTDLDRAVALRPDRATPFALRGRVYRLLGRHDEAGADLDRAVARRPRYAWALVERGRNHAAAGRPDDALADLDRAVDLEPDYPKALAVRGNLRRLRCRHDDAHADLDRAVGLLPGYAWAIMERALNHLDVGRHDEALADLDLLLDLDPYDAMALSRRAVTRLAVGRVDEARGDHERAVDLDPGNVNTVLEWGWGQVEVGRFDAALDVFERAAARMPVEALAAQGTAYRLAGRHDEALAAFDRALAVAPDHVLARGDRCQALRALGRTDDALAAARHLVTLDPDDFVARYLLGVLLLHRADPGGPDELRRAADLVDPDGSAIATVVRILCELATGDPRRAVHTFGRVPPGHLGTVYRAMLRDELAFLETCLADPPAELSSLRERVDSPAPVTRPGG